VSFVAAKDDEINLNEYISLEREAGKIVSTTSTWMSRATALHGVVDAEKQAELITLRDTLVNDLRAVLGV
jgi:hypothetical protein